MTAPSDTLCIQRPLAAEVGLITACIHAQLLLEFPDEREAMAELTRLTADLHETLPGLSKAQILQGITLLSERGLMMLGEGTAGATAIQILRFGSDHSEQSHAAEPPQPMTPNWTPPAYVAQVLSDYGIDESFWQSLLGHFRAHWMEKGGKHHWGSKFIRWVQRGWEWKLQEMPSETETMSTAEWQPSTWLCEELENSGIPADFILAQLKNFKTTQPNLQGDEARLDEVFRRSVLSEWEIKNQTVANSEDEPPPTARAPRQFGETLTTQDRREQ